MPEVLYERVVEVDEQVSAHHRHALQQTRVINFIGSPLFDFVKESSSLLPITHGKASHLRWKEPKVAPQGPAAVQQQVACRRWCCRWASSPAAAQGATRRTTRARTPAGRVVEGVTGERVCVRRELDSGAVRDSLQARRVCCGIMVATVSSHAACGCGWLAHAYSMYILLYICITI